MFSNLARFLPWKREGASAASATLSDDEARRIAKTYRPPEVVGTIAGFERAALGAPSTSALAVEGFEAKNSNFNQGVVCSASGLGTMVLEVLGERLNSQKPGDRASLFIKTTETLAKKISQIPGKILTVDFVISTEAVARADAKNDRVHAVITYQVPKGTHPISAEARSLAEAQSENEEASVRGTVYGAAAARRGVMTRNGILFLIDRQVHTVDGKDPATYQRNNLRYSLNRSDLIFEPLAGNFELKKCTHTVGQDFHLQPNVPTQEMLDAYVFKASVGSSHREARRRSAPLGAREGVNPEIAESTLKSIIDNEAAARGIKLPDGSTVRIVHMRPTKAMSTTDVHAHFVNLLAKTADEGDVKEVLGFDFMRPWGFHDKEALSPYQYFYPVAFLRTIDGPNGSAQGNAERSESFLTPAEYRAFAPMLDGKKNFDGVVHPASGYGAAVIEEFAAPLTIDGKTPSTEEQHLRFLKLIHAWFVRQKELGRDPEIISTAFALDEAEFTTPVDKQYRRRLRVYFRDKNVPAAKTWERTTNPDMHKVVGTFKEGVAAEITTATAHGMNGFGAGGNDRIFLTHHYSAPPGPGNPGVRDASFVQLLKHAEVFNRNPGMVPVEYIPIRYAWESQEVVVGASYTDGVLIRARIDHP
jgi:hypothetical protein